ncbi:gephyrin-like molybdotransferase Glp [Clostridium frigidicarnis]|uniref:Molybdopterin molybdenumtransferase n=1 Tax=Clostridium frigidicarnis TaxID=84698 RepID=A0A1I0WDJ4_9CLOT|nr:gephyrin-like molybdotransferase Glp [Clostridium frigidicarnis]SFA86819.1 molybdopterin molybdochelatase [Clostridium frigidicarnis]
MITIEEALRIIDEEGKVIGTERVELTDALNKVLAEDIYSKDTLPPFNKSAMDGYAIKFRDTECCQCGNEIELYVKALVRAGDYYEGTLNSKEAIKIMTGAPVPNGSDAVIQIEKVKENGNKVIISDYIKENTNIIKMGEEIKSGELALEKGKIIRPTEIGFLASLGYSKVVIQKSPKVALITTGDELLDITASLEKGKIRNSNEYSLMALCKNSQVDFISLGVVCDDKEALKKKILKGLKEADIVITSGGVSAGDFDFVENVLEEIGAKINFTSVAIKPGKPVTFATIDNKLFFGLPGNPLSVITTFEEFVKPAIKKMKGYKEVYEEKMLVTAGNDFKAKKDRRKFIYVNIINKGGKYYAYDLGSQCSNHLMTMSKANGIIIMPEGVNKITKGEVVNGRFIFK